MRISTGETAPTFESVLLLLRENALMLQETDRIVNANALQMQETDRKMQETDRIMKENAIRMEESRADFDNRMKESRADFDRRMKKFEEEMGGWSKSHGMFAEEYFFNSFEEGKKNFFGKKFKKIEKNLKSSSENLTGEYDIVLYNKTSIAIIETKFRARKDDVEKVVNKVGTFKTLFPWYKDYEIYLGLASLVFSSHVEQECIRKGIAIIKQVGDNIVINYEHLRVY